MRAWIVDIAVGLLCMVALMAIGYAVCATITDVEQHARTHGLLIAVPY
jgi:hypothetical protein